MTSMNVVPCKESDDIEMPPTVYSQDKQNDEKNEQKKRMDGEH